MKIRKFFAVLLAAAILFCAAGCGKTNDNTTEPTVSPSPQEETAAVTDGADAPDQPGTDLTGIDPLTGLSGYDAEAYANAKPVAIVVENHPGARPQWGMTAPDVLLEYEVEGGISRMLWLFSNPDEVPEKVGPVRSLRHDVYELAQGYGAFLLFCGTSNIVRDAFTKYGSSNTRFDLNASEAIGYRDRTRNVSSEHTLVLLGDRMREFIRSGSFDLTIEDAKRNPFRFAPEDQPFVLTSGSCDSLHYEFSNSYTYTLQYDEGTMRYDLSINGSPRRDADGAQCAYKNALILYVDMVDVGDDAGHQDLLLENGGSGIYATNGSYMNVTWQKDGPTDMLKVYSPDGTELTMNAGNTYIGLVRSTQAGRTEIG